MPISPLRRGVPLLGAMLMLSTHRGDLFAPLETMLSVVLIPWKAEQIFNLVVRPISINVMDVMARQNFPMVGKPNRTMEPLLSGCG